MTAQTSQIFESFVPVYDVIPDKWDDARIILVEQLKKIANAVNAREISYFLDEELLAGKLFIPGVNDNQLFRSVLRKVIVVGPIVAGLNTIAHGVLVDVRFTNIDLWASVSNSTTLVGTSFSGTGNRAAGRPGLDIDYDNTNIYILSNGTYDRCNVFWEYIQEL